ncbi:HlyD family efflux transporter periplasmic adaptor subunit [Neisseria wadsworthii]|uniref:Multidrug resistance protein A n=1 Tax=Neisseria wadsworthii 9715 TaxID=1030841 RepID=G4CTL3_9NEIS|nr:HlyD family efflux transporter periplasmic adaptor subunit [Neisseria wadsworthii]EGZ44118.1 multidrug resistance protein A [Neisseria wadsworthii 9715]QMT35995.1 HlyD family efflux transporter periplasmic adaptor subunit [Neisseria wadsworthii]
MNNTENQSLPAENESVQTTNRHRKRNITLLILLLIAIGLGFAMMYFLIWQYEQTTDNAHVAGHSVQIAPQIAGTVRKVSAEDTEIVKKGFVLVILDDSDYQLAYERAQNELIQAIRQNKQQVAVGAQSKAAVLARKADLAKAQVDLRRRESLAGSDAISGEELSHARAAVVQAQAALRAVEAEQEAVQASLGKNIPLRKQPAVQNAVSHIKDAWLNLQRTQIRAPVDGQVAERHVQIGQQVAAGMPLMSVVPLNDLWVEANFKESQLSKMRIGQPVTMTSEMYGKKVVYNGKVLGLSAGLGKQHVVEEQAKDAQIKVTQRMPVRISLDPKELAENPLRVGLSMTVKVSTIDSSGPMIASAARKKAEEPESNAVDWTQVEMLIEQVFEKYSK